MNDRMMLLLIASVLCVSLTAKEPDVMFVQSLKGVLRAQPKADASVVKTLKRGDRLEVIKKEGVWYEVSQTKQTGWISRLFLSEHQPIANSDINQKADSNLEKASRRRTASYGVSASTRGLMTSDRVRSGRELYRSDYDALEELEKMDLSASKIDEFSAQGKLTIE